MADTTYKINVDTRDATRAVDGLKVALGGLAAAFSVREIVQFADGITNLRNKLLTLTPDVNVVNQQFKALAAIAIQARTPLEATADLFFRIQRASKALGISSKEAADITSSVAKAISSSGLSAAEASGPLLQLGQALQSGTFQGDELRSILEGLPPVAQALAQELNVPVGALKKLGSEGQISADVFVKAMRRAKDSIEEAFGRTTPTITSALEGLKTNAKIAFDEFEKNTKTGQNLALSIEYLGFQMFKLTKYIDDIIEPLGTLIKIGGALLAFTLVGKAFSILGGLISGLVRGFTTLAARFDNVKDVVLNFREVIAAVGKNFTGLAEIIMFILSPIGKLVSLLAAGAAAIYAWTGLGDLIDKLGSLGDKTSEGGKELEDYRKELEQMRQGLDDTAGTAENAIQRNKELAQTFAKLKQAADIETDNLRRSLADTAARLELENILLQTKEGQLRFSKEDADLARQSQGIDQERARATKQIQDQIAKLNLEYSQLAVKDSKRGDELSAQVAVLQEQLKTTTEIYFQHDENMRDMLRNNQNIKIIEEGRVKDNERLVKLIEEQARRAENLGGILQNVNKQIQSELLKRPDALVGFTALQRRFIEIEDQAKQAAQNAAQQFAQGFDFEDDLGPNPEMMGQFTQGLDSIAQAYGRLVEVQKGFAEEQYNIQRSFEYGWKDALQKFAEDASDNAKIARGYFDTFVSGFESAIVKFVQTGKLSFKDLVTSMLAEFAKIQAKKMLFNFLGASGLGSFFGPSGGGAGASILGLPGFAKGGYLPSGQMGIVGESGPELITGPANITPLQNQQPVNITYSIQAVDASSFRALVARDPQFIYNITEQGRRSTPQRRLSQ